MTSFKKFYDLSQPVFDHCPGWPTYEPTLVQYEARYEKDRFNAEQIRLNSHTGTHLDAPFHFFPDGITVDQIDVSTFQGEAVIVDVSKAIQPRQGIEIFHLEPYSSAIHPGSIVILHTGWGPKRSAVDAMSMGGWYEGTGRPCHEELLSHGIWILEELLIPEELVSIGSCYLMAFPIKLQGFSGAPVRAVAAV